MRPKLKETDYLTPLLTHVSSFSACQSPCRAKHEGSRLLSEGMGFKKAILDTWTTLVIMPCVCLLLIAKSKALLLHSVL